MITEITHGVVASDVKDVGTVYELALTMQIPATVLHDPDKFAEWCVANIYSHKHLNYMRSVLIER